MWCMTCCCSALDLGKRTLHLWLAPPAKDAYYLSYHISIFFFWGGVSGPSEISNSWKPVSKKLFFFPRLVSQQMTFFCTRGLDGGLQDCFELCVFRIPGVDRIWNWTETCIRKKKETNVSISRIYICILINFELSLEIRLRWLEPITSKEDGRYFQLIPLVQWLRCL